MISEDLEKKLVSSITKEQYEHARNTASKIAQVINDSILDRPLSVNFLLLTLGMAAAAYAVGFPEDLQEPALNIIVVYAQRTIRTIEASGVDLTHLKSIFAKDAFNQTLN